MGDSCEYSNEPYGSKKHEEYLLAELLASQERICSMEFASYMTIPSDCSHPLPSSENNMYMHICHKTWKALEVQQHVMFSPNGHERTKQHKLIYASCAMM